MAYKLGAGESNASRKERAEADKAEAEAAEAAVKAAGAGFPTSTIKGPEGKVEADEKIGLISDLIAHELLGAAAERLARELKPKLEQSKAAGKPPRVLIVESADLIGSDWPYVAVKKSVESERDALGELVTALGGSEDEEEVPTTELYARTALPLTAATGLIGAGLDLASLFRGDYEITSREVKIGAPPLLASIAARLIPIAEEVNVDGFSLLKGSAVFESFTTAQKLRLQLQRLALEAKEGQVVPADRKLVRAKETRAELNAALAKETKTKGIEALEKQVAKLDEEVEQAVATAVEARALVASAEAAIKRFEAFEATVTKAPESGYPPLVAAAIRERLHDSESGYTHVLFAALEGTGGETTTRRTFLGTKIRFLGGAHISFLLWDVEAAKLVDANSFSVLGEVKRKVGFFRTGAGIERISLD